VTVHHFLTGSQTCRLKNQGITYFMRLFSLQFSFRNCETFEFATRSETLLKQADRDVNMATVCWGTASHLENTRPIISKDGVREEEWGMLPQMSLKPLSHLFSMKISILFLKMTTPMHWWRVHMDHLPQASQQFMVVLRNITSFLSYCRNSEVECVKSRNDN
jgi:hypothetical protein